MRFESPEKCGDYAETFGPFCFPGALRSAIVNPDKSQMEEIGKVVEVKGDSVKVELTPKSGCPHCPVRMLCHPGADKMYTEAVSAEGVKVGDTVKIDMDPKNAIIAAFLIFILPIVAFILGFAITQLFTKKQSAAFVGGVLMFSGSIVLLGKLDKRISKGRGFKPVVKQIVDRRP